MFKQLLIASLLIVSSLSATTLFSESSNSFAIEIGSNSVNENNTDVIITYTTPSTAISDSYLSSVVCVSLGSLSDLSFTNNTMTGFSFELTCGAPCTSSANLTMSEWVGYENIIGSYTASAADSFATSATVSTAYATDPVFTSDSTKSTATYNYLASTPANILTMGLPSKGASANYRCWGKIDYATTVSYKSATIITLNTLTAGYNVTLTNGLNNSSASYQAIASAIFAITALILVN